NVNQNRNVNVVASQAEGNGNGNGNDTTIEEWVILLGTAQSGHREGMLLFFILNC
ncbi:hypothetical protein Tco_0379915, partial [Tanacetum coccineum]